MRTFILISFVTFFSGFTRAQSIIGEWQLVKQSTCIEDEISMDGPDEEELVTDMKGLTKGTPQVIKFKENNTAEESTKIISRRKSYNSKSFLYKFDGSSLYVLDKKSRTIIEGFTVEKFEADSLIISNASRACDTKIFVKIR